MHKTGSEHSPRAMAFPLGAIVAAMRRDPDKLRILSACTIAAVAAVFEPPYLTLSTSFIQVGLRAESSPAPAYLAVGFLLLALLTLLAGTSADVFGRRLFLLIGLAGLTVSNILGLLWLDAPKAFAVADVLNAVSGVLVLPAAVAILTLTFEKALRPFAYGILFAIQGTAMVVGMLLIPTLGDVWEGRATFIPVLVLCIMAFVLAVRRVPESRAPESLRRGSIVANFLLMGGVFLAIFLIVTRALRSEQALLVLLIGLALIAFVALVRWLARRLKHFEGIEVYGGRDLSVAVLAGVVMMFAQGCFFFQITQFFWNVQELGDVEGALRFVPWVIGLLLGGSLVARLALRFGARRILVFSFLASGAALWGLSLLQVDSPFWVMIVPITLLGLAAGLSGPARTTVVLGAPPEGLVNSSAAVNAAAGQIGYALGAIVSSVLVTQYADEVFVSGLTAAGVSADTVTSVSNGLQDFWSRMVAAGYPGLPDTVKSLTGVSYAEAFTSGMTRMFFIVAIATLITAFVVLVGMRRGLQATWAVPQAGMGPEDTQRSSVAKPMTTGSVVQDDPRLCGGQAPL